MAKVGEVIEVDGFLPRVNELLADGWVLIGFVERMWNTQINLSKSRAVYILGKPREKPKTSAKPIQDIDSNSML